MKEEEQKLIEHTRTRGREEEEGRGEGQGAGAAEVRACRAAVGSRSAALARRQARVHPRRRARGDAKRPNVPELRHRVGLHGGDPGAHVRWRRAGPAHARGHESRDRQDGVGEGRRRPSRLGESRSLRQGAKPLDWRSQSRPARRPPKPIQRRRREVRWSMPIVADGRGRRAARAADNKDRWLVARRSRHGQDARARRTHDDAWVRESAASARRRRRFGWLPDRSASGSSAEHDGWMHLYTVDATPPARPPRQLTQGKWEIDSVELSPDGRRSTSPAPKCIRASGTSTR